MSNSEWSKFKERLIDIVKNMDDTPTEDQTRLYDLTVGALIAEGDKMQDKLEIIRSFVTEVARYDPNSYMVTGHITEPLLEALNS